VRTVCPPKPDLFQRTIQPQPETAKKPQEVSKTMTEKAPPTTRQDNHLSIEKIQILENRGNLKALVDVRVGTMTLRECRVVQQPGQRSWASFPMAEGRNCTLVTEHDPEFRQLVKDYILHEYDNELYRLEEAGK
jgi:CRISPR/Cas system-associated exonuclease Cas4 (RecB family)